MATTKQLQTKQQNAVVEAIKAMALRYEKVWEESFTLAESSDSLFRHFELSSADEGHLHGDFLNSIGGIFHAFNITWRIKMTDNNPVISFSIYK